MHFPGHPLNSPEYLTAFPVAQIPASKGITVMLYFLSFLKSGSARDLATTVDYCRHKLPAI